MDEALREYYKSEVDVKLTVMDLSIVLKCLNAANYDILCLLSDETAAAHTRRGILALMNRLSLLMPE